MESPESGFVKHPKSYFWMRAKNNLFRSRKFHKIIAKLPILSGIAKREGEDIFKLMAGFVATQILYVGSNRSAAEISEQTIFCCDVIFSLGL